METLSWQTSTWSGQPGKAGGSCSSWSNSSLSPAPVRIWEEAEPHSTAMGSWDLWVHDLSTSIPTETHTAFGLGFSPSKHHLGPFWSSLSLFCKAPRQGQLARVHMLPGARGPWTSAGLQACHRAPGCSPLHPPSDRNNFLLKSNCHLSLERGG